MGGMSPEKLSNGCKALILMKFPDKFDAIMMDTGKEIHSRKEFILEFYKINGIF